MRTQVAKVPGVRAEIRGPIRGGPFPTLNVSWDPKQIGMTAGEVGHALLEGEPRIATHAEGDGHSFLIRPVALKDGEHKIVAQRLYEVLHSAPKPGPVKQLAAPVADVSGVWNVEMKYEVGSARHKLFLVAKGNQVTGSHEGWAYRGGLKGHMDGDRIQIRSLLPADGNQLAYTFRGAASGDVMSGEVDLGEYGQAKWRATRHMESE